MILYRSAALALLQGTYPLTNARIGYVNYARGLLPTAVTVSTEHADGPRDAPLRSDTAEWWMPTALPAWLQLDLGSAKSIDYAGLVHDFGSTGCAVRVQADSDSTMPDPHVSLPGVALNNVTTPSIAALNIVGDIELDVGAALASWTAPAATQVLLAKRSGAAAANTQYMLCVDVAGKLNLIWSDGAVVFTKVATVALTAGASTQLYVKATLDVNNGAAGNDVKFWQSTDKGSTWAQVGATVTTAGVTSIQAAAFALELGSQFTGTAGLMTGKIFYAAVRNGIGGAVVSCFDPATDGLDGAATMAGSLTGNTWLINASGGGGQARLNVNLLGTAYAGYAPADDTPLMLIDAARLGRYLRVTVTGGAVMPKLPVLYAGLSLVMAKQVSGPYVPISMGRSTKLTQSMSRGGQFLGQSYQRNGVEGSARFENLDDAWVRASFDAFSKSARRFPYFFAWNPSLFPQEVGYVWTEKDIVPKYSARASLMDVSWQLRGVGSA